MTLLTILSQQDSTPQPPAEPLLHGDGYEVRRPFKLPGEVKERRKRLPKSVVKRAKKIAEAPEPTIEAVGDITRLMLPLATEDDTSSVFLMILAEYRRLLDALALQEYLDEQERQLKLRQLRERIILEQIAEYLRIIEDDEMLIVHLI